MNPINSGFNNMVVAQRIIAIITPVSGSSEKSSIKTKKILKKINGLFL